MEQLLAFILGMVITFGVFFIGYSSLGVFRINKINKKYSDTLKELQTDLDLSREEIHRRIDGEIGRVDSLDHQTHQYINETIAELNRQIDSRFDKFENRLKITTDKKKKKVKQLLTD